VARFDPDGIDVLKDTGVKFGGDRMTISTKTIYLESGVVQGDRLLTPDGRHFHIPYWERENFPNKVHLSATCFHYSSPFEGRNGYIFPGSVTEFRDEQSPKLKQNHEHQQQQSGNSRGNAHTEDVTSTPSENSAISID
jgi:hypothetical protein